MPNTIFPLISGVTRVANGEARGMGNPVGGYLF